MIAKPDGAGPTEEDFKKASVICGAKAWINGVPSHKAAIEYEIAFALASERDEAKKKIEALELRFQAARNYLFEVMWLNDAPNWLNADQAVRVNRSVEKEFQRLKEKTK